MYCQHLLARLKPEDPGGITAFYYTLALGGFLGGIVTVWIVPLLAASAIEYFIGLGLVALVLTWDTQKQWLRGYDVRLMCYFLIFLSLWLIVFKTYNVFALILIYLTTKFVFVHFSKVRGAIVGVVVCVILFCPFLEMLISNETLIYAKRNYYGIYRVFKDDKIVKLSHGTTIHGSRFIDRSKAAEPVSYYSRNSPIGKLFIQGHENLKRIGVIGLGTGTIATYIGADQAIDFYELDPDVLPIAKEFFGFVNNCAGKVEYLFGDARVSLDNNPQRKYDVLIVDAFGGDSIPIHLLTWEMVLKYKAHLNPKGVLIFHISNRYLNLRPVLGSIGSSVVGTFVAAQFFFSNERYISSSDWVAFTWDADVFEQLLSNQYGFKKMEASRWRAWTDSYSNILPIFQVGKLVDAIRYFPPFAW